MPFYYPLRNPSSSDATRSNRTVAGIKRLRAALATHFETQGLGVHTSRSVRIATWNLREFGGRKGGGRDYEPLYYIAEVISHMDLVALQEVRQNLKEFDRLKKILGPDWSYLATDVTDGSSGNGERMVYLFNRRKVLFQNIAGELSLPAGKKVLAAFGERLRLGRGCRLVLPDGEDLSGEYKASTASRRDKKIKLARDLEIKLPSGSILELPEGTALTVVKNTVITRPRRGVAKVAIPAPTIGSKGYALRLPAGTFDDSFKQFARSPYIVAFQAGWLKINLCTVHIYYGDDDDPALLEQRRAEIQALTDALGQRAEREMKDDPHSRTMTGVLGDFNIISQEHETMQALENSGFLVPDELKAIPGTNVDKTKAYDQIAFWKPDADRGYASLEVMGAGVFDFFQHVYRGSDRGTYRPEDSVNEYRNWRTYKMSDHLPMWIELRTDFTDAYLDGCGVPVPA